MSQKRKIICFLTIYFLTSGALLAQTSSFFTGSFPESSIDSSNGASQNSKIATDSERSGVRPIPSLSLDAPAESERRFESFRENQTGGFPIKESSETANEDRPNAISPVDSATNVSTRSIQRIAANLPTEPIASSFETVSEPRVKTRMSDSTKPENPDFSKKGGFWRSLVSVVSCLTIVLGVFFGIAFLWKKFSPEVPATVPSGVVEIIGQFSLTFRVRLYLLRLGSKLVLVSASGDRVETLSEITDPEEVAAILKRRRAEPFASTPVSFWNSLLNRNSR